MGRAEEGERPLLLLLLVCSMMAGATSATAAAGAFAAAAAGAKVRGSAAVCPWEIGRASCRERVS